MIKSDYNIKTFWRSIDLLRNRNSRIRTSNSGNSTVVETTNRDVDSINARVSSRVRKVRMKRRKSGKFCKPFNRTKHSFNSLTITLPNGTGEISLDGHEARTIYRVLCAALNK